MKKVYIDSSMAENEIISENGRVVECSICGMEMEVGKTTDEIVCPDGCEKYEVEVEVIK